jgi:hypothetical protein
MNSRHVRVSIVWLAAIADMIVQGCLGTPEVVVACEPGYGNCDGRSDNTCETRLEGDTANCGSCGHRCTEARPHQFAYCSRGACQYACAVNFADCDGQTANGCEQQITADASSCGRCGRVCAASQRCFEGRCAYVPCPANYADCDEDPTNRCEVDLLNGDPSNCGACGRRCNGVGFLCVNGECVCEPGLHRCPDRPQSGDRPFCVDTRIDRYNCGSCGVRCRACGYCVAGGCVYPEGHPFCY